MDLKTICVVLLFIGVKLVLRVQGNHGGPHYCALTYYVQEAYSERYTTSCGWWGRRCNRYRTRYRKSTRINQYACCTGYTGRYCNIPICNNCKNNAVCIAPNQCYCRPGSVGSTCELKSCSASNDCYPGTCFGSSLCRCASGFSGSDCRTMLEGGTFRHCKASFQYKKIGKTETSLIGNCGTRVATDYTYYSSVGSPDKLVIDYEVFFNNPPDLPPLPSEYMVQAPFGLIGSNIKATLKNTANITVSTTNIVCTVKVASGQSAPSQRNPHQALVCKDVEHIWAGAISHNYVLELEVISNSGGFKEYVDPTTKVRTSKNYVGTSSSQKLNVRFDLQPPTHCSLPTNTCENEFQFPSAWMPDVTNLTRPTIIWFGWNDTDSGIKEYRYTVYSMELKANNRLTEVSQHMLQKTWVSGMKTPQLNFTVPGMYSTIVEVYDNAGNVAKTRSVMLLDHKNKVEKQEQHPVTVPNAENWENAFWVTTTDPVVIQWDKRYINKFHHENKLLHEVEPMAGVIDDTSGNRTTAAIANVLGVVKFEINFNQGDAKSISDKPTGQWKDLKLAKSYQIPNAIKDGQTIAFFIKAYDAIGNIQEDTVKVHVDATPAVYTPTGVFTKNDKPRDSQNPYISTITLDLLDLNSGIQNINITLIDVTSAKPVVAHLFLESGQKHPKHTTREQCISSGECYCIPLGPCYTTKQTIYINHCDIRSREGHSFVANFTAKNGAGLDTIGVIPVGILDGLSGIGYYPKAEELRVIDSKESADKATLAWAFRPACYSVTGLRMVFLDGNSKRDVQIPAQSKTHQLSDLQPATKYTVEIYVLYEGGKSSDPSTIVFTTGDGYVEDGGLGVGAIVGMVIGILILLLLVIVIVILIIRRKQDKPMVPPIVRETTTRIRNRLSRFSRYHHDPDPENDFNNLRQNQAVHFPNNTYSQPSNGTDLKSAMKEKMALNVAYFGGEEEDDIYIYGNMETDPQAQWKVSDDRIVIGGPLPKAKGRFADLKVATLQDKNGSTKVIAKMNKVGASEEDKLLMTAKMNFLATGVERHEYIVNFIAAVPPPQGPIILLEYCEEGKLVDWLKEHKNVTPDVEDMLSSFTIHIALGMQHLHNQEILHRRLGARNVLLKPTTGNQLVAKITGFGPMKGEHDGNEDVSNKREKVPIKWMAPEQFDVPTGSKRVYNDKTDVWSYGITLHEIYNQGESPYSDMTASDAKTQIHNGYRLPRSEYCPEIVYDQVMKPSWEQYPNNRPAFNDIVSQLKHYFDGQAGGDVYYYDHNSHS